MKWRSHTAIGRTIADHLQLPPGERKAFLDGIVEPDRHKERGNAEGRSYRISHHRAPIRIIMLHVWMARRSFIAKDTYQGFRHLGMALHYLQDRSTSKGWLGISHRSREERLAEVPVPARAVESGMARYVSSPEFVRDVIRRTRPLKDPGRIMAEAAYSSAAVTAAVLDAGDRKAVQKALSKEGRGHYLVRVPLAVGSLAIGISLSFAWHSVFPGLICLAPLLLAIVLDGPYRRLVRLAGWYGLRRH